MAGKKGKSGTNPNSQKGLRPATENMTHEQIVENARKGGKASVEKKRQRKEMRELVDCILNTPMKNGKVDEEINSLAEAKNKNLTVDQMIILAQVKKAIGGDTRAAEFLRDTVGDKPVDRQEITVAESPLQGLLDQLKDDEEGVE